MADRFLFMDAGEVVGEDTLDHLFTNPQADRTKLFLSQIFRGSTGLLRVPSEVNPEPRDLVWGRAMFPPKLRGNPSP